MKAKTSFKDRIAALVEYIQSPYLGAQGVTSPAQFKSRLVGRTIRHIEPWSVFKVSLVFYLCVWVVFLIVALILWGIASVANLISRLESFLTELLALESYNLPFSRIFLIYSFGSLATALVATAFTVLMCIIYNQISGIFGGIRMLVLEEESFQQDPPPKK